MKKLAISIISLLIVASAFLMAQDTALQIKYKIIEIYPDEHQIVVRYYTDLVTEQMLATDILDGKVRRARTDVAIDLPIPLPSQAEIHKLIQRQAQVAFFKKKEAIVKGKAGPDMNVLVPLKDQVFEMEVPASP